MINKFVYYGDVKFDLTSDTVTKDTLLSGVKAHDKSGAEITGRCTYDADTSDADVTAEEVINGKIFYARGSRLTGKMPNNGKVDLTISDVNDVITIPKGCHDGSGSVTISSVEKAKLIPENIREGVEVLGLTGTMSSSDGEKPQTNKTVTPAKTQQVVTPDSEYTCLMQVTVEAIPYSETSNSAGGTTITIG